MKIVILDSYTAVSTDLSFDCLKEITSDITSYDRTQPQDVVKRIGNADAILINKTQITKEVLEQCPNLKYIGIFATGYNMVDLVYCKGHNIVVSNVPGYSTNAVAQLTFSFILNFTFLIDKHNKEVHEGKWIENDTFCYYDPRITELYGKTLGVVGFGNIAKQVARIASAFDMNVVVYSRTKYPEYENENLHFVDMDTLLQKSDIITLHVPLFKETEKLINRDAIAKMKQSAILINTARGGIIDEQAVADALNCNKLAGAGLDVTTVEPILKTNPLLTAKNCVITPHIAWSCREARARLIGVVCDNIKAFQKGEPQNNVAK
ncbi:MAG: D-2-hydroxyacid dehydrogenase [Oscillospiraceae bacterium]